MEDGVSWGKTGDGNHEDPVLSAVGVPARGDDGAECGAPMTDASTLRASLRRLAAPSSISHAPILTSKSA